MRTCVQCGREHQLEGARCGGCHRAYHTRGDASPTRPRIRATSDLCALEGCGRPRYVYRGGRGGLAIRSSRYCLRHMRAKYGSGSKAASGELHAAKHAAAQANALSAGPPPRCPVCFAQLRRGVCPECKSTR